MKSAPSAACVAEQDEYNHCEKDVPELPGVESFENSETFYKSSPKFLNRRSLIKFAAGFKCSQCTNKNKHGEFTGYCFIHKRIIDLNGTCPLNSRNKYKNVNFRK